MAGPSLRPYWVKMKLNMTMAKRGDVILKLGPECEAVSDVLVSSGALSLASPVFEAMFSGRFLEGQMLSAEAPREVPLPNDDPRSMLLICMITHFRTADLPKQVDPISLANFAVACDKYQCIEAVQAWAKVWSTMLLNTPSFVHFEKVLFATYVLDLPKEFNCASLVFIRDRNTDINIQRATHGHDFLPILVFDKLLFEKYRCETKAYEALHAATSGFGNCEGSMRMMALTLVSLRTAHVWPLGTSSISQLKSRVNDMNVIPSPFCPQLHCSTCTPVPDIKGLLVTAIEAVYNSAKGICLDCVKREVHGDARICRVSHPGSITSTS